MKEKQPASKSLWQQFLKWRGSCGVSHFLMYFPVRVKIESESRVSNVSNVYSKGRRARPHPWSTTVQDSPCLLTSFSPPSTGRPSMEARAQARLPGIESQLTYELTLCKLPDLFGLSLSLCKMEIKQCEFTEVMSQVLSPVPGTHTHTL